jgi:hypothetical protein
VLQSLHGFSILLVGRTVWYQYNYSSNLFLCLPFYIEHSVHLKSLDESAGCTEPQPPSNCEEYGCTYHNCI